MYEHLYREPIIWTRRRTTPMIVHFLQLHPEAKATACNKGNKTHLWPTDHLFSSNWEAVTCSDCLKKKGASPLEDDVSGIEPIEDDSGFTDDTPMPFGKYRGNVLSEVPAAYLHWLWTQRPLTNQKLEEYIRKNIPALKQDYPDGVWT